MAATRKYALCVIDDDPDELGRFKKYFGKCYFIGIGATLRDAESDLRATHGKTADLFVLDMYFPTKVNTREEREALNQTWEKVCIADSELKAVLGKMEQASMMAAVNLQTK